MKWDCLESAYISMDNIRVYWLRLCLSSDYWTVVRTSVASLHCWFNILYKVGDLSVQKWLVTSERDSYFADIYMCITEQKPGVLIIMVMTSCTEWRLWFDVSTQVVIGRENFLFCSQLSLPSPRGNSANSVLGVVRANSLRYFHFR